MSDIPQFLSLNPKSGNLLATSNYLNKNDWSSIIYLSSKQELNSLSKKSDNNKSNRAQVEIRKFANNFLFKCGIGCAKWLNDDELLFGTDTGNLVLSKSYCDSVGNFKLEEKMSKCEHDGLVNCLDATYGSRTAITGSSDSIIKFWDLDEHLSIHTYKAHDYGVRSLRISPDQSTVFISSAEDHKAFLWDTRKKSPAFSIAHSLSNVITTIDWSQKNVNLVAFGTESGEIAIHDMRHVRDANKKSSSLILAKPHTRQIRKLCFSNSNENTIASCSDDRTIKVNVLTKENEFKKIYESEPFVDLINDIAWNHQLNNNDELIACCWNGFLSFLNVANGGKQMEK